MKIEARTHPDILFAYIHNYIELRLIIENNDKESRWIEADITVPERISLSPDSTLKKGRVRVGIAEPQELIEKAIRIYGSIYTIPQIYRIKITVYSYDKDGVIDQRMETVADVRCEMKKPHVI